MKNFAIIVAGGSGTRMGTEIPKQFLALAGKPILMHTIMQFLAFDAEMQIVVVLPESQFTYWKALCAEYKFELSHQVVAGGASRFQSVKNGLNTLPNEGVVFIHDGVRPLVSQQTIAHCLDMTLAKGNALPVVPVVDSIRELKSDSSEHKNRADFRLVQTPQTFQLAKIKSAFNQEESPLFTDDASVLEATGEFINLVEGNVENIKITTKFDLSVAHMLIQSRENN